MFQLHLFLPLLDSVINTNLYYLVHIIKCKTYTQYIDLQLSHREISLIM